MSDVILFLQSGDNGPVRLVKVSERAIKRNIDALQKGNPELLHMRMAVQGDERTEHRLHAEIDEHYLARDWYDPGVLKLIPTTFLRYKFDATAERQRISRMRLAEIVKRP